MLMEAIRLSLAAEEDRRKKAEKDADAEAKKENKKKAKEQKKVDKAAKKGGFNSPTPSHEGVFASSPERSAMIGISPDGLGKGKARVVDPSLATIQAGFARSTESLTYGGSPQHHLEQSRAVLDNSLLNMTPSQSAVDLPSHSRLHKISTASSTNSSLADSPTNSYQPGFDYSGSNAAPSARVVHTSRRDNSPATEPMFNFGSLATMIDNEHEEQAVAGATDHGNQLKSSPNRTVDSDGAMGVPSVRHAHAYNEPKGFITNTSPHDEASKKQASH